MERSIGGLFFETDARLTYSDRKFPTTPTGNVRSQGFVRIRVAIPSMGRASIAAVPL